MNSSDWRDRLATAITESGKSKRSISQASGNGPGYVHSILSEGKEPTINKLMAVCEAIPVSVVFVLHGHDVTPEDEELLEHLRRHPSKREAIQRLLSSE